MQALEKIGVLEQDEEKGGRRITQSGQRDLDRELDLCSLYRGGVYGWGLKAGTGVEGGGVKRDFGSS